MLFEYPKSAAFGRILPKSKIYQHANPGSTIKELFIRQIEQIVWHYKLAPETIKLAGKRSVPEIQIFSISLKEGEIKKDVLRCIDQAIPFPIFFELRYDGKIKAIAAYKRPSEADGLKWVISDYFETAWMPNDILRKPLPLVFDLESLYASLLAPLMPFAAHPGEGLQAFVERTEEIQFKQRELEKCKARLRKEKQFNRKLEINTELRKLKHEIDNLTNPLATISN